MAEDKKLNERVGILENVVKTQDKRILKVEDKNDAITRLTILFENQEQKNDERERRQDERDRKQQEQLDKFSETMINVNNNLTNLNNGMKDISERVTIIEEKNVNESINQLSEVVEKIDDRVKNIEKRKIDWNEFIQSTTMKVLGTVVTLGILAWLASQFGWSFLK